jgi:hypothetical protein
MLTFEIYGYRWIFIEVGYAVISDILVCLRTISEISVYPAFDWSGRRRLLREKWPR